MQLLRIKLDNWRGVGAAEIQLDSTITIVEGDNEAGKSSFIEALNLLFRERDSTKKQELKRVTPKGVDVGSQVEVEFTTGPYHLTYSKTFNKKSATTLFIHKPGTVQLVGAEAHDRVLQILDETIDFGLWQAIQLEQGGEFTQVNFKNSDSLAQALDNAAGGSGAGDGESALLEKVKSEYLKYYTEKAGKETGELATLREAETTLQASAKTIADSLAALEAYVDDSARISTGLASIQEQLPAMQLNVAKYEKQRAESAMLQQQLKACESQLKTAELGLKDVERQTEERRLLHKEITDQQTRIAEDAQSGSALLSSLDKATAAFDASTKERDKLLKETRMAQQNQRAVDSETELASIRIDDVQVNRIEKLEQLRREQEIQIRGNSAEIKFKFLKDTLLDNGQSRQQYSVGDEVVTDTSEKSTLTLDDNVRIEISPAADNYEMTLEHHETIESLRELLRSCDVASVSEAIAAHRTRAELTTRLREMKRSYKKLTNEQSLEGLATTIDTLKAVIAELELSVSDVKADPGQAGWQQLDSLEQALISARDKRDLLQQQCADAKTGLEIHTQHAAVNQKLLDSSKTKLNSLNDKLSESALAAMYKQAKDERSTAEQRYLTAKEKTDDAESAKLEMLVGNATQSLQRAQNEIRDLEIRQADVKARLDQMQSEGLHEKQQLIMAECDDNAARLKQLDRRARAASKLWTTLCRHQREAQLSYARPLAERVASMGRVVFGEDFSVELSQSLNIVSRTLKGTTVPFEDLSGGAREQLGILLRLAAAQLVSGSESMPLILDDTLGHTDAGRLETMGAILNNAARSSQIVVMTCYPARYSYVGGAKVVKLFPSSDTVSV